MTFSTPVLKILASSIYHHFRSLDHPAADEIFVPLAAFKQDDRDKQALTATIRFVVNYCGRKENSVRIKFKVDDKGRFLPNSWAYTK